MQKGGILRAEKVRETHKKPKSKPSLEEPKAAHQHKFSDSLLVTHPKPKWLISKILL
jgi:hypothetical protein